MIPSYVKELDLTLKRFWNTSAINRQIIMLHSNKRNKRINKQNNTNIKNNTQTCLN
jgi:hypothetical protein